MVKNIRDLSTATLKWLLIVGSQDYDKSELEAELNRRNVQRTQERKAQHQRSGPMFGPKDE